jgi:hypothetical protein
VRPWQVASSALLPRSPEQVSRCEGSSQASVSTAIIRRPRTWWCSPPVGSQGFVYAAWQHLVVIYNHYLRCAQDRLGAFMARPPNYSQDKKRREEAARKKREEKQQKRQQKKDAPVTPTQ